MEKLGLIDLEILFLAINGSGEFNERDIENSNLKRLGVGRILDSLASLKDRKLIALDKDGTFLITDLARHVLWNDNIPLWVNILRLLEIKSFNDSEIAFFLRRTENTVLEEIEKLRKNHLVLMSPQRIESKIVKVYEIMPEGIEKLKAVEKEGFEKNDLKISQVERDVIQNQLIREINDLDIPPEKKDSIISKVLQMSESIR